MLKMVLFEMLLAVTTCISYLCLVYICSFPINIIHSIVKLLYIGPRWILVTCVSLGTLALYRGNTYMVDQGPVQQNQHWCRPLWLSYPCWYSRWWDSLKIYRNLKWYILLLSTCKYIYIQDVFLMIGLLII